MADGLEFRGFKGCDKPPKNWRCTGRAGHQGPCAAVPAAEDGPRTDGLREALYHTYLAWVEQMAMVGEPPPIPEAAAYQFANYAIPGVRAALSAGGEPPTALSLISSLLPYIRHDTTCRVEKNEGCGPCTCGLEGAHDLYRDAAARTGSVSPRSPEAVGYYVWAPRDGYAFRNKLHETREAAEAALASVVWHNRDHFEVRPVYV